MEGLRIHTLGDSERAPWRFNPLQPPPGTTVHAHISSLMAVFRAVVPRQQASGQPQYARAVHFDCLIERARLIARKPRCQECTLEHLCNSADKTWSSH